MPLFNASVIPALFYALETVHFTVDDERKLDALQNKCMRKMLDIRYGLTRNQMMKFGKLQTKRLCKKMLCTRLLNYFGEIFIEWRNQEDYQKL